MALAVQLCSTAPDDARVVAVPVFTGRRLPAGVEADLAFLEAVGFEGKPGETALIANGSLPATLAVGLGDADTVDLERLRRAAAAAVRAVWRSEGLSLALLSGAPDTLKRPAGAQALAEGALLGAYRFTKYKTDAEACRIRRIDVVAKGGAPVAAAVERGRAIAAAVAMARDLVNEPPEAATPSRLAQVAQGFATEGSGLTCEVLDEKAIKKERLGGLEGVSRGSAQPPRLIKLTWDPPRARASVVLVGKGITFDSGGLSLKSADGMMSMKMDMSGAAAVLAVMSLLPELQLPIRVVGIVPTTENLPGGKAYKPGDVLRIRNGKTVEVLNTDAEGRLILADGLSLAVEEEPNAIVDLATLTGACVVALGKKVSGLMGNNDGFIDELKAASDRAGEPAWPLPLPAEYRKDIDSKVADIKNIGTSGSPGALTAGLFLKEFVGDVPWAHLDIAGPAWADSDDGYLAQGATAVGVRTLVELLTSGTFPRRPRRATR
jgi:leucyl aminopeptidase